MLVPSELWSAGVVAVLLRAPEATCRGGSWWHHGPPGGRGIITEAGSLVSAIEPRTGPNEAGSTIG